MENTESSSTFNQYQNKATENFNRLCQLFVTICSELFRDVIMSRIDDLRLKLDEYKNKLTNKQKCKLLNSQEEILYPKSKEKQTDLKDMDFSLLYILLRHICGIPDPKNGWGNNQEDSDPSIGACIDRIRVKRNVLFAHAHTGSIETDSFHHEWGYLKNNIVEIAKECNSVETYEEKVQTLQTCMLDPSVTTNCLEIIKKMEGEMKMELQIKKETIEEMKEDAFCMHHHLAVNQGVIEKCITTIKEIRDDMVKISTSIKELQERVDNLEEVPGGKRKCPERSTEKQPKGELSSEPLYLKSPVFESSKVVPDMFLIHHITGIKSDRLWVGGVSYPKKNFILKQVDSSVNVTETIDDADISFGNFAITQKGELLYSKKDGNNVQKKTLYGTTTIITTTQYNHISALYSSQITGDLLVGVRKYPTKAGKLTRYDKTGARIKDLEEDEHGRTLYIHPVYIAENKNGDIVTVDFGKHRVVLVNRSGEYRGYYNGQTPNKREFEPHGVCTDVQGHIMVVDYKSSSIHLLDQDLHFLTVLLTQEQHKLNSASALFVDENHHLYVGSEYGRINVYKYLKDV